MEDDEAPDDFFNMQSQTYPMQVSALRKGANVMIDGHACLIVDLSTGPYHKGKSKMTIVGTDILTNKRFEMQKMSHENVEIPKVSRMNWILQKIEDDDAILGNRSEDTTKRFRLPEGDFGRQIKNAFNAKKPEYILC